MNNIEGTPSRDVVKKTDGQPVVDFISEQRKLLESYSSGLHSIVGGALTIWFSPGVPDNLFIAATTVLGPTLYWSYRTVVSHWAIETWNRQRVYTSPDLGYSVGELTYEGAASFTNFNTTLTHGDTLALVELPNIQMPTPETARTLEFAEAWEGLLDITMKDVRKNIAGNDVKCVALVLPDIHHNRRDHTALLSNLLEGKRATLINPEKQTVIFSKQEFDDISEDPHDLFYRAVDALDDLQVSSLIDMAKGLGSSSEYEKARILINERLDRLIHRDIQSYFNGPERIFKRDLAQAPYHSKIYRSLQIRQASTGFKFVQTISESGELRQTPLDKLLEVSSKPIDDILKSESPFVKAQIAYIIGQMIEKESLGRLLSPANVEVETVLQKLIELGCSIPSAGSKVSFGKFIDKYQILGREIKKVQKKVIPFITPYLLFLTLNSTFAMIKNDGEQVSSSSSKVREMEQFHRTGFPDAVPTHSLDWRISGTLSPAGYYTESTSHELNSAGEWEINDKVAQEVTYPTEVDTDNYLRLESRYVLNPFGDSHIRIPLKDGTVLAALKIQNEKGLPVTFTARLLTDGNVQVTIPNNPINGSPYVDITAHLTAADSPQVHASEQIEPIDVTELTPEALQILNAAQQESPSGDSFEEAVAEQVNSTFEYSLNPLGKERLAQAQTPEEMINAIATLTGASCDVANTQSVLLTTVNSTPDHYTNIALGYLVGVPDNLASNTNTQFLMGESRHAYGIDENGVIRDATPIKVASDEMTNQYIQLLRAQGTADADTLWETQKNTVSKEASDEQSKSKGIAILAALLTSSVGYIATLQGRRFINKLTGGKDLQSIADNFMLFNYSERELAQITTFFNWISWGGDKSFPVSNNASNLTKPEIMTSLRANIRYDKLDEYINDPKQFEKQAAISGLDRMKFRAFARYLLS